MVWYEKWAIMVIVAAAGLAGYEGIPWSKMGVAEWAYWVGALGSIGSIAGAYFLGERHARASFRTVLSADRVAAYRKGKSILAVTDAVQANATKAMGAFDENSFNYVILRINYDEAITRSLIEALANIPVHELGSYNAVAAILRIRTASGHFEKHVQRCFAQAHESHSVANGAIKPVHFFDTIAIEMCVEDIVESNGVLTQEIESMQVT